MVVPLYVCGLAAVGMDEPFHDLESRLKESGASSVNVTGKEAAEFMLTLAKKGQQSRLQYKIPYECEDAAADHEPRCAEECGQDGCKFHKQCNAISRMWLTPEEQDKAPYAGQLSDHLAKHLINFYLEDLAQLKEDISALLRSHSDVFLKRWKKLSKDKRGRLLSAVCPRAFGTWPAVTKSCGSPVCYDEHLERWHYGFWLTIRDIAEDWMKLVSLLHTRSAYGSSQWAQFDLRVGGEGFGDDETPVWFHKSCVVMYEKGYGSVCEFDKEMAHRFARPGFPLAFHTIQGQHELMYTLKDILTAVVADATASGASTWNALVEDGLHPAGGDAAWNPYLDQPFTKPVVFSPDLLHQKAHDRLSMIKDELMLMQTDPAYTQELIKTRRIVVSNTSKDLSHKSQTFIGGGLLMMELLVRFNIWQTIESRCSKLKHMFEHYGAARLEAGEVMPREITLQMSALEELCKDWFYQASKNFEDIMHSTKTMQQRCQVTGHNGCLYLGEVHQLDPDKPVDRLRWRIMDLRDFAAEGSSAPQGYYWLFATLEREESIAQIMDKPTREHISDMMIIDEIRTLTRWSQRAKGYENFADFEPFSPETFRSCCVENDPDCHPPHLNFGDDWYQRTSDLIQAFVDAPWPKGRKDLAWLAKANKSRRRLADLWQGVASEYKKAEQACCGRRSACAVHFTKTITAFATDADYVAMLEQERRMCEAESARLAIIAEEEAARLQEHIIQSQWGSTDVSAPVCRKLTKTKPKVLENQLEHKLETMKVETEDVPAEPIAIQKESLVVFHKMYRAGTEYMSNGTIRWPLFVHAMKDAGFTAEEASGSAVSFRDASGKSICFHRPHPDPVLDHIMLYGMAKRMTKWFGFSAESFVLREKDEAVREA